MCHKIRYYFSGCTCIDVSRDFDIRCDEALRVGYECANPEATGIPMKGLCPDCQEYYREYYEAMRTSSEPETPVPESQAVDICKPVEEKLECQSGVSVPEGHDVSIGRETEEPKCQADNPVPETAEVDIPNHIKEPMCHLGIPVPKRQGTKACSDIEEPRRPTGIPAPRRQEVKARSEVDKKARYQSGLPVPKNQEAQICNQVDEKPKRQTSIPLPRNRKSSQATRWVRNQGFSLVSHSLGNERSKHTTSLLRTQRTLKSPSLLTRVYSVESLSDLHDQSR
ncbi:uncharacterized protein BO95DRAFT_96413 [Aspergillus brunneoviolaceus CBS 621.78]|uniref:Uncharacterized protein n=1 Tax=Aspergillus brunneoviolaceus CBS 621.78 TaxID=1450534 RepID=A0ACD1GC64_9EURO|nr:hypothetical protein BO95DRAFT_96413 [Aspergillus brunneoviolaceus CBS 621.78]RAH46828.1 hypothetical protein BO95DRAFT_96413 [Aspergillus brunneoviolaceus CBS 621.78]